MVLHFEQVNELRHVTAFLNSLVQVVGGVVDEFVDSLLVSEDAVLLGRLELVHAQVGLARHQQAALNNVDEAESKEVQRNLHEPRG